MYFRILGTVQGEAAGRQITFGWRQERQALGILLIEAGHAVPTGRLMQLMWGETIPRNGRGALQSVLSRLRKSLSAFDHEGSALALNRRGDGYELAVPREQVDLHAFRALMAEAHGATDPETGISLIRAGLGLWRGPALADATDDNLDTVVTSLEEERISAQEHLIELLLRMGRNHEVIPELIRLIADRPERERLHGQLLLALHRSGRRLEALEAYQRLRRTLADDFGLTPSGDLQQLHWQILDSDRSDGLTTESRQAQPRRPEYGSVLA
ncbi:AfsR/SARP family transcriptional regulator [Catellatospora sp. KI3]|uniref:AfsR/SARP family transcriptional regulator n=1 Tax=Catellatospora sp. KI3 TaxID=3041620 RepID=UPI0024827EB6|nr:AfsR/SARP family transcriptional regulator [Catellatospora sp. KI3]MDI1459686.1 AfsR/SARP family transcriptional regulator [Catellatospora sp. KI3]